MDKFKINKVYIYIYIYIYIGFDKKNNVMCICMKKKFRNIFKKKIKKE